MRGARRVTCALAAAALLAGCRLGNPVARGERIVDAPGLRPSKVLGMAGEYVGYAAGAPCAILLLPTLAFRDEPGFSYSSSSRGDIPMPILFAPMEYGSGFMAFAFNAPLLPFKSDLGEPGWPTEEPPPRKVWRRDEAPPGAVVPPGQVPPPSPLIPPPSVQLEPPGN
jgi:hypothetical protein